VETGSPPRAWGKAELPADDDHVGGFTPTGVGKSRSVPQLTCFAMVHPHGRGEKFFSVVLGWFFLGSPPRAWGKAGPRVAARASRRFTPTGVGKSRWNPPHAAAGPVHPHGRGEKMATRAQATPSMGSPPRAWGKVVQHVEVESKKRFTPTGVGKSPDGWLLGILTEVHPHGRGEKRILDALHQIGRGSPPRAWGKGDRLRGPGGHVGFTPTGVGKRSSALARTIGSMVHPHGRGEKAATTAHTGHPPGSPPRAWGKAPGTPVIKRIARFTPTGVGKRLTDALNTFKDMVHPHGRGEKTTTPSSRRRISGSPPRAWGKGNWNSREFRR